MSIWQHRYRTVDIGSQVTITEHQPGRKIALVLEELQDKVLAGVEVTTGSTLKVEVRENILYLTLPEYPEDSGSDGDVFPDGGEQYQVLQIDSQGQPVWDWTRTHE